MERKTIYLLDTPQADSVRDAKDGVAGSSVSNAPNLLPANMRIENTFSNLLFIVSVGNGSS